MRKSEKVDGNLGSRIRARRKATGLTLAHLADSLGVSFQQVQKYEKGLSRISGARLEQICHAMNVPPDYFNDRDLGLIGKAASNGHHMMSIEIDDDAMSQFVKTGEGSRLVKSFMSIGDQQLRTHILDFIASVAADKHF